MALDLGVPGSLRSLAFVQAIAIVAGLDDVASMGQPIQQRGGHLGIAEHGAPFAEGQVGRDYQRYPLVQFADQMEQQRAAVLRERQVAEFVEDNDILVEQPAGQIPGSSGALFSIELVHKMHHTVEARLLSVQDDVARQGGGQMRFVGAGSAHEDDIAGRCQVISAIQLAQLGFIDLGFVELKAIQIPRHREARQAQLVFVGARLSIRHFRLQQLRQPHRRGELFLAQGRQALLQCARHAAQAQGFE